MIKLEEMIVNSVLEGKKYRHWSWLPEEYIYWCKNIDTHCFRDERNGIEDISDYSTMFDGWKEWKGVIK